jgi:(p)ppGpp synthase/HD superfamily hydrolase
LNPRFAEALAYTVEKHGNQTRKGGDIPYLGHLLTVAGFVIDADGTEA